jgi:predicted phage terminase large subunit-like protein
MTDISPEIAQAAEEFLKRDEAKDNLLTFVEYTHPRWTSGPHHAEICEKLEAVERGEIKRLMIFAPPRHSKSELASRRFPAWYIGRHPEKQLICASHTEHLASDIGADIRDIIADPIYKNVFEDVSLNEDAKAAGRWRTSKGGICVSVGAKTAVAGRGADIFIFDDIIKGRNAAESPRERDLVWRWFIGDAYQRLQPGGAIVFMTTRWHEDDPAGRALEMEEWEVLNLQAIANENTDNEKALWPKWWPLNELRKKRKTFIAAGRSRDWQAQYQQNPTPQEGNFIKRKWLEDARYVKAPENLRIYMAADFAVTSQSEGKDPDRTEIGVFGIDAASDIYVLDWWSGKEESHVWIEKLIDMVKEWKPMTVFGEKGVIRNAVEPFLNKRLQERKVHTYIEWMPTQRDKLSRGRSFQAWASTGRVRLPAGPIWADEFITEVCLVPAGRYWDKFDTTAHMFLALDELAAAPPPDLMDYEEDDESDYGDGISIQSREWRVM